MVPIWTFHTPNMLVFSLLYLFIFNIEKQMCGLHGEVKTKLQTTNDVNSDFKMHTQ